jgi:arylformamidase
LTRSGNTKPGNSKISSGIAAAAGKRSSAKRSRWAEAEAAGVESGMLRAILRAAPGAVKPGPASMIQTMNAAARQLWDISPPVHAGSPVFPGDAAFSLAWNARIGPGCPVNVSTIHFSPHTGAHADAPLHYDDEGAAIGDVPLAPYLGRCRVIHAIDRGPLIEWAHIEHALRHEDLPPRVLVRTYRRMPLDRWDAALAAYAPQTIERLADLGVLLVGIDTASIDPADSKALASHQVIRRRGLRVLENLVLDEVPEGDYELIALPLKLTTACASPVRAVLRNLT